MLVHLGREWSGINNKKLPAGMNRDPYVIRLYSPYTESRNVKTESKITSILKR